MSRRNPGAHALRALIAVSAACAFAPAMAGASTVNVFVPGQYDPSTSSSIQFNDSLVGDTTANDVSVSRSGDTWTIADAAGGITSSTCTVNGAGTSADCSAPSDKPIRNLSTRLGEGDDKFTCSVASASDGKTISHTLSAAQGNDNIKGCPQIIGDGFGGESIYTGRGNDTANGDAGDDSLYDFDFFEDDADNNAPQDGNDTFLGGPGDDFLFAWGGTNTMDGGPGLDELAYAWLDAQGYDDTPPNAQTAGAIIALDSTGTGRSTTGNGLQGQNDTIANVEDASGTEAADTITGSPLGNILRGFGGDDTITGGAGPDNIQGNGDNDTINAQDAEQDRVQCGGQTGDKATVDNVDLVSSCPAAGAGTTVINVPPVTPVVIREPTDTTKAVITSASTPKKVKTSTLKKTGKYKFKVKFNEVVTTENTLSGKLGSKGFIATAGYLTLAEKRVTLAKDKLTTITLTIPKGTRKSLKKGKSIRLLINARDAGNNITSRRVTIKLT
jgi:hypothetical protein